MGSCHLIREPDIAQTFGCTPISRQVIPPVQNDTVPQGDVEEFPLNLDTPTTIQYPNIKGQFGLASVPGDIQAPGYVSVHQAVDMSLKLVPVIERRKVKRPPKDFDNGSKSCFTMCFNGRFQA